MRLTPRDVEKLMLHTACSVAQKRYARGLKLNYPEAIALISGQLLEFIRDGHTLAELTEIGTKILGTADVMVGVAEMIDEVQVEGTLVDGTKLVSVHNPIQYETVDSHFALHGSGLTKSASVIEIDNSMNVIPGETEIADGQIEINSGRKLITVEVYNSGTRSVQVGSHCAFAETNRSLKFDRAETIGYRLNIPAGAAVRFESGTTTTVELVELAGEKVILGGNNLVNGNYFNRTSEIVTEMQARKFVN